MKFSAVSVLQVSRWAVMGLIVGSAACVAAAGPASVRHSTETVLYNFKGGSDGVNPLAGLVIGQNGALYGTSSGSPFAPTGNGTVFKLKPPAPGQTQWTKTVLYSFEGGSDGASPIAGLIFDHHGALYGTTWRGGHSDAGAVFMLTPPACGRTQWTETVLYSFKGGSDGANPAAGLIFDTDGALYGTTSELSSGAGTVFKLTPPALGRRNGLSRCFIASRAAATAPALRPA